MSALPELHTLRFLFRKDGMVVEVSFDDTQLSMVVSPEICLALGIDMSRLQIMMQARTIFSLDCRYPIVVGGTIVKSEVIG